MGFLIRGRRYARETLLQKGAKLIKGTRYIGLDAFTFLYNR
jgi:hypothetical protein